jgi:ankyrin repeat protein
MDWLLKAQLPDGSWHVATRIQTPARISPPYFESGFPHGKDQYISCSATAWALLAMAEALPQTGKDPAPAAAARARGVEPWMEKAYFGTVDELRALLDGGLNPNAATPEGNSVLMFAAHDAAKVRLLLARGADAKFRSKSGFDALMVSTLVRGSSEASKALLAAGAEVNPKARTRFRANPLSLAAVSGDALTMRVLLDAGANPQAVMAYVGIVMMRPFEMAAQFGYEPVVRMMAERGYKVDSPDDQGMTALTWAGIMHRPETAKLLMQLGANPAHKDNYGLTPAQEAETIRYAPQEVLQVLKSGGGR